MSGRTRSKLPRKPVAMHCICPPTPETPLPDLPPDETERHVRAALDAVASKLSKIETSHDHLANTLVHHLFRNNPAYALDPTKHPTTEYKALQAAASNDIRLDQSALSRHIRVGALNLILGAESAWARLPWTYKTELLPLLELDGTGSYLALGIKEASKRDASVRKIQAFKKSLRTELEKSKTDLPHRAGLDLGALKRLVSHGTKLRTKRAQTELLKKLARLPDDEQAETLRGMVLAARNLVTVVNRYGEANDLPGFTMSDADGEESDGIDE